jgi:hypothetical protein
MENRIVKKEPPIEEAIPVLAKISAALMQSSFDLRHSSVNQCIDETVYFTLTNQINDSLKGINLCIETLNILRQEKNSG